MTNSSNASGSFDPKTFLSSVGTSKSIAQWREGQVIFWQGDPADAVFYIRKGKVKVTTLSPHAKEAVVAILGTGDFFGEGCLAGQPVRVSTAIAMADSLIARIDKAAAARALHEDSAFSEFFITYLLARNVRLEADLIDHLFNSSEKRLARLLLLLANFGADGPPQPVIARISQQTLAEMVGTTRARVSFFMNKFRRLGFIDYNGHLDGHGHHGHIEVRSSLLNVLLQDETPDVEPLASDDPGKPLDVSSAACRIAPAARKGKRPLNPRSTIDR